jgi:hypothetical protein
MRVAPSFGPGLALTASLLAVAGTLQFGRSDEPAALPKASIDGTGTGWKPLSEDDFTNVNCEPETWTWKDDLVHCTGQPVGVIRSKKPLNNFELVAQWRHFALRRSI